MKNKQTLLLILLLSVFAINHSYANTKSTKMTIPYSMPVFCDGQVIDVIHGSVNFHFLMHFNKAGQADWIKQQISGNSLEGADGTYSINQSIKMDCRTGKPIKMKTHANLVGANGTVYQSFFSWKIDPVSMELEILKQEIVCH